MLEIYFCANPQICWRLCAHSLVLLRHKNHSVRVSWSSQTQLKNVVTPHQKYLSCMNLNVSTVHVHTLPTWNCGGWRWMLLTGSFSGLLYEQVALKKDSDQFYSEFCNKRLCWIHHVEVRHNSQTKNHISVIHSLFCLSADLSAWA